MIQKEVVQLIRTYNIFGLLRYAVVAMRKQLGRDGSIQHIEKYFGSLPIALAAGCPLYQMSDQCFGDTAIDTVHTDMIAIVGTPPESKFAHIACTDYESPFFIGDVHKYLCPFASLRIFVCSIVNVFIVSNIDKMLHNSLFDRYSTGGDTQ